MTHRFTAELRKLAWQHHDACISCGYQFREADTAHVGYGENDSPLYVCDGCSGALKETAARYYFMPRPYEIPPSECKLWRYTDFTKYISMLSTRALYFTRVDCFEDKFEGAKGLMLNKADYDTKMMHQIRQLIRTVPGGENANLPDEEVDRQASKLLGDLEATGRDSLKHTFVNCWHENPHESAAMWRLYSSYLPNAVAIRSSYQGLYKALGENTSISIGRVKYVNLRREYVGVNEAFWRKVKSFEHEREVRAVVRDHHCEGLGRLVTCDLSVLIEEVFVSPNAPAWFVDLVNDVTTRYGIAVKVSASEMVQEPFF